MFRWAVVAIAIAAAFAPLPPDLVERLYSSALYPRWQSWVTSASNLTPLAWFDVLLVGLAVGWIAMVTVEFRQHHALNAVARILGRSVIWASALYLVFLASWGLN